MQLIPLGVAAPFCAANYKPGAGKEQKGRWCLLLPLHGFRGRVVLSKAGEGLSGHKEKATGLR